MNKTIRTAVLLLLFGQLGALAQQPSGTTPAGAKDETLRTTPVQVGETAPDFALEDEAGRTVQLAAARGKMPVVLVFYRGWWCPYCARQLSGLRSLLNGKENVALYAVSIDAHDKGRELKEKIAADGKGAVNFPLLSDPGHRVITAYGLVDHRYDGQTAQGINFEGIPVAATYVIDKEGRVAWARFDEDYKQRPPNEAIRAALAALKK